MVEEDNMNLHEQATAGVLAMLAFIGEDCSREGLLKTPERVVKAMAEMTIGYKADIKSILAAQFNAEGYDQMVICRDIEFVSLCEHHMLPFTGVAHVAYIPDKRIVGLSKMARLVDAYSRRLQVQERLTEEVATAMLIHIAPKGVGVMIQGKHACMSCRGVLKQRASMVTTSLKGVFLQPACREEFMLSVGRSA